MFFHREAERIRAENVGAKVSRNDLIRSAISRGIEYWQILRRAEETGKVLQLVSRNGSDQGTTGP